MKFPQNPRPHHAHQQQCTPGRRILPDIISVVRSRQRAPTSCPAHTHTLAQPSSCATCAQHAPHQGHYAHSHTPSAPWAAGEPPQSSGGVKGGAGQNWGGGGMAEGGREEHRFCCIVARMRLVIHLQTILRGTANIPLSYIPRVL